MKEKHGTAPLVHVCILLFAVFVTWATLSFTDRSPEAAAQTQANFNAALINTYPWLDQVPAPRALVFQNGDSYKTIRLVSVINYSYVKTNGENTACITYRYLPFDTGNDKQSCGQLDLEAVNVLR